MSQKAQMQCPGGRSIRRDLILPWDFQPTKYNAGEVTGTADKEKHMERGPA